LRIVGFLHVFYSQAAIPRTTFDSPSFLEHGSAEKIPVCDHTTRDRNREDGKRHFCIKRLRTLKCLQIFKTEIKKLKPIAVDAYLGLTDAKYRDKTTHAGVPLKMVSGLCSLQINLSEPL
jgi:hypothetical protein